MKLVLFEWVKESVSSPQGYFRGLLFYRQSIMLQFPLGLIHKENASFPTVTSLLLRPCNEEIILCLHFSLLAHICTLGNQA